jgi:ornithine--oxo-acid transaminase
MITIGKALSGGMLPVSAVVGSREVLDLFEPGSHGSTFGGNPLGSAVAREALKIIVDEDLPRRARELGDYFMEQLREIDSPHVKEVRGKGLLIGVELKGEAGGARPFCEALTQQGILAKETHVNVMRFAPPLVITQEELDWALERVRPILREGKC